MKEVWSFLGFGNFYRKFINKFSELAAPLNELLKKDETFNWTPECQMSFDTLKQHFTAEPILMYDARSVKTFPDWSRLLSYNFPRSFWNGKDVENNSGQECTKSGMLPVTDKDLASMYLLCRLSPTLSLILDRENTSGAKWERRGKLSWDSKLVLESLVTGPQKDHNQTGLRLQKTKPTVRSFDFWESKTGKRPVLCG